MLNRHSDEEPVRGLGDSPALQALLDPSLSTRAYLLGADVARRIRTLGELARQGVLGGDEDGNATRLEAISELEDLSMNLQGREEEIRAELEHGASAGTPFAQAFSAQASHHPLAGPAAAIERVGAHWVTHAEQTLGQMRLEMQQSVSAAIKVRENRAVAEVSLDKADIARLRATIEKELPGWIRKCKVDAEAEWKAEVSALLGLSAGEATPAALAPPPPAPIELPPASLRIPPSIRLALPNKVTEIGASIRSSPVLLVMVGAGTIAIIAALAKAQEGFGSSPPGYLYAGVLLPTAFIMAWIDSSRDRIARWRARLATVRSNYNSVICAQIHQGFESQRAKLLAWIRERKQQWASALRESIASSPKSTLPEPGNLTTNVMPASGAGLARLVQEARGIAEMRSTIMNIQSRLREEVEAQVGLD